MLEVIEECVNNRLNMVVQAARFRAWRFRKRGCSVNIMMNIKFVN
jgi:hypothetical protein